MTTDKAPHVRPDVSVTCLADTGKIQVARPPMETTNLCE